MIAATPVGAAAARRLLLAAGVAVALGWLAAESRLLSVWLASEEYGHGLVVLAALGWLLWQRRQQLALAGPEGWGRVALLGVLPALAVVSGALAGSEQLQQYGLWLFLVWLAYAWGGRLLLRCIAEPLLALLLIIPMPYGMQVALTAKLQLLSSELGAALIRAGGGIVHLAGNTMHMGGHTLLVDEACSGLRYLFPLLVIAVIGGYLLELRGWRKAMLLLAAVAVTVLMNSVRIAAIGLLAERQGVDPSQGWAHAFEGWMVFMTALALLGGLAVLLVHTQAPGCPTVPLRRLGSRQARTAAIVMLTMAIGIAGVVDARPEQLMPRSDLAQFPVNLGAWRAETVPLTPEVVQAASTSDHYFGDLRRFAGERVNLYIGYYASQRHGAVPHSPLVCLPGDGWQVKSVDRVRLVDAQGHPFEANRVLSTRGRDTVLAYFWIKQGRANHASGWAARAALLGSTLITGRSDAALVRLVTEVNPDEAEGSADARLTEVAGMLSKAILPFVPD